MKKFQIKPGLQYYGFNKGELKALYHEVFETETYLRFGITLQPGSKVIDLGANCGLFSHYIDQRFPGSTVWAIEAIPDIFEVLKKNAALHFPDQQQHMFQLGISDAPGNAEFVFSPTVSMNSGMHQKQLETENPSNPAPYQWMMAFIEDAVRLGMFPKRFFYTLKWIEKKPLLRTLLFAPLLLLFYGLIFFVKTGERKVQVELSTLSEFIKTQHIDQIDLVKIDIEGAELAALLGIHDNDFSMIRQLVIEVHDIQNRVQVIRELLLSKGYHVEVAQEDWTMHKLLNIHTIYASQPSREKI